MSIERKQPSTESLDMTSIFVTLQKIITAPLLAFALMTPMPEEPRFKSLDPTYIKAHSEARILDSAAKTVSLNSIFQI